ncbi:MAG: ABC transporter ATP-binding protein [Cellvibrionaceae bacterium]|nr:ABC transporter ATP-binding protein [Cellvibrionaceae bacterium]
MLKMQNLRSVYRSDLVETHALRDVNLEVEAGEFIAVTGPSGSGKTTFLNIAGLLDTATSGDYFLEGQNVSQLKDNVRSKIRNEKIGFIFQSFNLIPELNIYENIEVPLRYRGFNGRQRRQRIVQAMELVGIASRSKHLPAQLSGGQQQRAAIARALSGEPRFLLADEPTGNLDSLMARQVMELLETINQQGTTVIMVTHDPELARRAKRNVQLLDGEVSDMQQPYAASLRAAQPPQTQQRTSV